MLSMFVHEKFKLLWGAERAAVDGAGLPDSR